jgi:hypothetical protein
MHSEHYSERFLGEPELLSMTSEILTDRALEVAFHARTLLILLLDGLHTYK